MQDRFKFRVWDKASKKMHEVFGFSLMNVSFGDSKARSLYHNECILMQCTGLKDKNGKLIFEGDIIECNEGCFKSIARIEWDNTEGWVRKTNTNSFKLDTILREVRIIGNIHENPELLEA